MHSTDEGHISRDARLMALLRDTGGATAARRSETNKRVTFLPSPPLPRRSSLCGCKSCANLKDRECKSVRTPRAWFYCRARCCVTAHRVSCCGAPDFCNFGKVAAVLAATRVTVRPVEWFKNGCDCSGIPLISLYHFISLTRHLMCAKNDVTERTNRQTCNGVISNISATL